MRFDKGYISPYFVTDPERMEAVLDDPYILLVGSKISSVRDMRAGAREGHAVRQAARDHRRGRRGRGPRHPRGQQDPRHVQARPPSRPPASASAARRCCRTWPSSPVARSSARRSASSSRTPRSTCSATAKKVIITKDETTIVEGAGVRGRHQGPHHPDQGRDRQHRLATTTARSSRSASPSCRGGVAVLKVGAATEVELKEKKHRIEDAVSHHQGRHRRGRRARRWRGPAARAGRRARRRRHAQPVTRPPVPAWWPRRSRPR